MNILFICRYNRFRSKVAEELFNKYNKNINNHAKSAGLIYNERTINKIQNEGAKKWGINLTGNAKPISLELLEWHDVAIIVADNVPPSILKNQRHGKKVIQWKVADVPDPQTKTSAVEVAIKAIDKKVKKLIKELK